MSGIQRKHLDELRALASPPQNVRLALEPVIALVSGIPKKPEWNEIKEWLRKPTFIMTVMTFDKDSIAPNVKKFIKGNYLDKKDEFVIEKIFKASQAAGPLAKWVQSLVDYADIFERIQPLRNEVAELEHEHNRMREEMEKLMDLVKQLEMNIEQYKVDYSQLIGEV